MSPSSRPRRGASHDLLPIYFSCVRSAFSFRGTRLPENSVSERANPTCLTENSGRDAVNHASLPENDAGNHASIPDSLPGFPASNVEATRAVPYCFHNARLPKDKWGRSSSSPRPSAALGPRGAPGAVHRSSLGRQNRAKHRGVFEEIYIFRTSINIDLGVNTEREQGYWEDWLVFEAPACKRDSTHVGVDVVRCRGNGLANARRAARRGPGSSTVWWPRPGESCDLAPASAFHLAQA